MKITLPHPAGLPNQIIFLIVKKIALAAGLTLFFMWAIMLPRKLFAQAPTLSYATPKTYTAGTAITPLAPTSSGVAAAAYNGSPVLLVNLASQNDFIPTCIALGYYGGALLPNMLVATGSGIVQFHVGSGSFANLLLSTNGWGPVNGLVSDGKSRFFFTTGGTSSVWEIDYPGNSPPVAIATGGSPCGLAIDSSSNIYYGDQNTGAIKKIPAGGGSPVVIGNVNDPQIMTADAAGDVYVGNFNSGTITEIPAGGGAAVQLNPGISGLGAASADASGNLFIADVVGNIDEIPAGGGSLITLVSGHSMLQGVAADASGNVFYSDSENSVLEELTPAGGYYLSAPLPAGLSFNNNTGVISGAPVATSAARDYTITAYNSTGSVSAPLNITIGAAINSLTIAAATPNNSSTVNYTAVFSGAISNLSAGNFSLAPAGAISGETIGTPTTTDGGTTWTIPINTGIGDGTVRMDLVNSTGVSPAITTTLPFRGGSYYTIDKTPPIFNTTTYKSNNANSAYAKTGDGITLSATFNEQVQTPVVTIGGVSVTPVNVSGNTWNATYTVTSPDPDGYIAFDINAADLAGNTAEESSILMGLYVTIDNTSPTGSISAPSVSSIIAGTGSVSYTVTYTDANFNTGNLSESDITLNTTGSATGSVAVSQNSPSSYTVTISDIAGAGSLGISIGAGTASDLAGNTAPAPSPSATFDVLGTDISSITAVSSNPTNAASVNYTASFGAAIAGLTASNFSLTTSGATGASVGTPTTTDGGTTWTVPVNTGAGDGTLQLILANASGVSPGISTALPFAGDTYTIDKTAPTAAISAPSVSQIGGGGAGTVSYTVTYADANFNTSNLTGSGITLNSPGTATGTVTVTGSGTSYTVTISSITGIGTLGISVAGGYASDQAGNTDLGAGPSASFNVVSTDASLSNLVLTTGLTPVFSPGRFSYIRNVGYGTQTVRVTPTTTDPNATILVDGTEAVTSGTASDPIALNVGDNIITIAVLARDGTTSLTYTVRVTRAPSTNDKLSSLKMSKGIFSPVFSAGNTSYTDAVGNTISSVTVTPVAADPTATIKVNGTTVSSGTTSGPVNVPFGSSTIHVAVTAQDGTTSQTYAITVNRPANSDADLAMLRMSMGRFSWPFDRAVTSYNDTVGNDKTSIKVIPTTRDTGARVTVNGVPVISGDESTVGGLVFGDNIITVTVTAEDGTTKTYTVTVVRHAYTSANLVQLKVSKGIFGPAFDSGTTSYTDNVGNSISSITVTPTTGNPTATVKVNGVPLSSGTESAPINLAVGSTTISIDVKAQDSVTTKTYTVTVIRASSNNDNLTSLKMSKGTFSPTFASGTTSYTDAVGNTITSVTVTPTTSDPDATVKVNGITVASGTASGAINVAVGANTINVVVTASDNVTTKTYTVTVNRASGGADSYDPGISVTKPTDTPILAEDGIQVHQAISPNGDGLNDFLQIDNIGQYPDNKLTIMNRNGQLIYEATGYDNASKAFDGHSNKNGQMQLPGTYFYQLDYTVNGIAKHKTGFLVLKY